ncbi:sulfite exporter TauE/SafE family protein [Propionibacteriaceae bacterium Y1923]|uniref:sulfite exporter TauE/SafE family protein n=1 Tax=Aestuariimicrobium sp. Y1814 TaxID=3418742 RepID=UPI003C27BCD3
MTLGELALLAIAAIAAGAINALVGSGTLITFPTLIAFGVVPVSATMSNAIGLVAGSASGAWGYRRELRGQWKRLRWQVIMSLCGALVGCWLLLHLPETVFATVVPGLLVLALLLVVFQPRIQDWVRRRTGGSSDADAPLGRGRMILLLVGTFAVGIYGGYFTAAQGILLMGLTGALLSEDLQRLNAAKNVLALVVNVVAAVTYTLVAPDRILWDVVLVIAVGSTIGGLLGARYGRRLRPGALRVVIVVVGLIGLIRLLMS